MLFVPDGDSPPLPVLVGGEPENVDEVRAKEILSEGKFEIKVQLGIGEESAKYWTCDFSYVSLSFPLSFLFGSFWHLRRDWADRKSTRLNSSHI